MNKDKITVTLALSEFDKLREESNAFQFIREQIAECFSDYGCIEHAIPEECKACVEENPDCSKCEVFKDNPPYKETIALDVERLVKVCKQYALYDKDITSDIDDIEIIRKTGKNKSKKSKSAKKSTVAALSLGGKSK